MSAFPGGWNPISLGQRGLWFEQQADPGSNAYNLAGCVRFEQAIDAALLDRALQLLAERHPLMRARFGLDDRGEPAWRRDDAPLQCQRVAAESVENARNAVASHLLRPYDLASEHPFRFVLATVEGGMLFGIGCHHIVSDLHSLVVVVRDLDAAYRGAPFAPAATDTYGEFVASQRVNAAADSPSADGAWWRARLGTLPAAVGLGELEPGDASPQAAAARIDFAVEGDAARAIESLARQGSATPFGALLTAFQALWARRLGESTAVVGVPSSGRNDRRHEGTVGYFVNLLPLAFEIREEEPWSAALARNALHVREGLRHGHYPFAAMVRDLQRAGAPDPAARIRATLTYQKTVTGLESHLARLALGLPGGGLAMGGAIGTIVRLPEQRAQFPLGIAVAPTGERFDGCVTFDPSRISRAAAQGFLDDWLRLLALAARQPDAPLGRLLDAVEGSVEADLATALERAFERHAHRTALSFPQGALTYDELRRRTGGIATRLRGVAIGPGHRVAVVGAGGVDTICALVAVLRSGAAFVPIDAAAEPARLHALLQAAQVSAVLACDGAQVGETGVPLLEVAKVPDSDATAPGERHGLDPAWLMSTSGTTGTPKLAVVPHEGALAHARGIARRLRLREEDRVLQFASLSFDEHAEEIFPTLLTGACIVCRPRIRFEDPEALLSEAARAGITVLHLPTSYWHLWMDELEGRALPFPPALRLVNAGGEQPSVARLRTWIARAPATLRWVNSYGLTEAAVTSLVYEADRRTPLDAGARIPAGRPLAQARVRIVAADGRDVPDGETGELWLGGPGVGLGYFGDEVRTRERFSTVDGVRWLRSGDFAYRQADGQVVMAGRGDRAFKVRGVRIEPAEIEAALLAHPAVKECVVTASGEGAIDVGAEVFVAVRAGHAASEAQLLDFWRARLPGTPPPRRIAFCAAIPRTAGLKPDFKALRMPDAAAPARETSSDPLERAIATAFAQVLQRDSVDPQANFFALGGHSLLAMRLVAMLRHALSTDLGIADFMAQPTIEGVAQHCRSRGATTAAPGAEPAAAGPYALSDSQARVLALSQAAGVAPRATLTFALAAGVEHDRLRSAWREVIPRHPLLWARIDAQGNEELPMPTAVAELADTHPARRASETALRGVLATGDAGRACLVIEGSYLALDGGAVAALLAELDQAYRGGTAAPRPRAYRDYVAAHGRWTASPARAAANAYWEEALRGAAPPTRLASRQSSGDGYATRRLRLALGAATRQRVIALARAQQCTPFAVLLSAFAAIAARFAVSDEVLVGVPVSGSEVLGLGPVIGPTLNPMPLRLRLERGEPFTSQVRRTRDALAAGLPHAALPFEEIAAATASMRGQPLPLQFVAQDAGAETAALGLTEVRAREGIGAADLLVGVRLGATYELHFEFRAAIGAAESAALVRAYRQLLTQVLRDPAVDAMSAPLLAPSAVATRVRVQPARAASDYSAVLHHGLERSARGRPDGVALQHGEKKLAYGDLDALANRHAHRLIAAGVVPGDRVAIASARGVEEIVAVLAVLKAGAVYVPIAADMPALRARALRDRAGCTVVTGALAPDQGAGFVAVDLADRSPCAAPRIDIAPESSAYILFTSGSTGEPKGVEMSHAAAMLTVGEMLRRFELGADDVFYAVAALDFDLSVFDIFGAFAAGARLVLPATDARADAFSWARDLQRHAVTVWNSVPSALDILLEAAGAQQFPAMRRVLASGDWIGLDLPARAGAAFPQASFVALGGATEAAIWSNCEVVERVDPAWRSIPYGRALDGHSMFVADANGAPLPAGVVGEILIGGGGLAKGYWGAPALTAERFVANAAAGRVYRTGDLGRHFGDGAIEFLGRADRQVKVRGYRIESGEVEVALATFPGVQRAVVTACTARGAEALAAYVIAEPGMPLDLKALRRHADERLPAYMRPAFYRTLTHLPLGANGKVDLARLPPPEDLQQRLAEDVVAGFDGTERRIASIWADLLPQRAPRRDEDFFAAGGHSLLAVRLLARVRQATGVEASLPLWLREPTIAHLARMVEAGGAPAATTAAGGRIHDLRGKVRLDAGIRFDLPPAQGATHVVTGAAGLIGRRLVTHLLAAGNEVIALVRAGSEAREEGRLRKFAAERGASDAKLRILGCDLARPLLGLDAERFAALAHGTGAVHHLGAAVNLVAGYAALEAANVGGTHEAIRLAALAGAPLHHVSSVGVLPYGAGRRVLEIDSIDVDGALLTGYCESKWVAEQTVRLAMAQGLRAVIYRPGLTIDADDAAPETGLIPVLLDLARRVGALPRLQVPVDLVDADYVAAALAAIAANPDALGGTFHLTHPQPLRLLELLERFPLDGAGLPLRDFPAWRAALAAVLPTLRDPRAAALGALVAAHDEATITPAAIDCSQALALLAGTRVACRPVLEIIAPLLLAQDLPCPA